MADKKKVAKTAGIAIAAKKALGTMTKLVVLAAVGAAVIKVLGRDQA